MAVQLPIGTKKDLDVHIVDFNGLGVTAQSPRVSVRRESDGKYFNGSGFQTGFTDLSMTELDSVNHPGVYTREFDQSVDNSAEIYLVHYINPGSGGASASTVVENLVFSDEGVLRDTIPVLMRNTRAGGTIKGTADFSGPVGSSVPIP